MIRVENVSKDFGKKRVLHNISFEVPRGEILGFLGPNAAGKTTTMRIITGFIPATEGTAFVAGYNVFDKPLEVKRNIGYLPETPPIYPEMSVINYLKFVANIKGIPGKDINTRIEEAMEKVSITHVRDRLTGRLSKGYRQRVGLAQALIHNPQVLILDEPTSGLDPKQIIEVRDLIKSLAGDHTLILSTHILHEVSAVCNRIIIINNGRLVAQDTTDELKRKVQSAEKLTIEVGGPEMEIMAALNSVAGVKSVQVNSKLNENRYKIVIESNVETDIRKDIAKKVAENNWDLYELRSVGMSLEDIFMKLTSTEEEV